MLLRDRSVLFRILVAGGAVVGGFLFGSAAGRLSYGLIGASLGLVGALLPERPRSTPSSRGTARTASAAAR